MRAPTLSVVLSLALAAPAAAKHLVVQAGGSIQAAIDQANPGDTVSVGPGTYHETGQPCPSDPSRTCAVVITKDNIQLAGESMATVILENPGGQDRGIEVARDSAAGAFCLTDQSQRVQRSRVRRFTVNGFEDDGVLLLCVDDWRLEEISANNNVEYGLFPSHCGKGRVKKCVATGANDTGIYIGQSHDVHIDHNVAHDNVSGFEIENSTLVRADHNESHGNTGGILTFTLPFLDVNTNHDNRIDHNNVHDNNKANTCVDPGDAVCAVPVGTGILVLAADTNRIDHNTVTGNNTFGIAVANYCNGTGLTQSECDALDINPDPDGNAIEHNSASGNGSSPDLPPGFEVFAVDLAWDLFGTGNCWKHNMAGTTFPAAQFLPTCP